MPCVASRPGPSYIHFFFSCSYRFAYVTAALMSQADERILSDITSMCECCLKQQRAPRRSCAPCHSEECVFVCCCHIATPPHSAFIKLQPSQPLTGVCSLPPTGLQRQPRYDRFVGAVSTTASIIIGLCKPSQATSKNGSL